MQYTPEIAVVVAVLAFLGASYCLADLSRMRRWELPPLFARLPYPELFILILNVLVYAGAISVIVWAFMHSPWYIVTGALVLTWIVGGVWLVRILPRLGGVMLYVVAPTLLPLLLAIGGVSVWLLPQDLLDAQHPESMSVLTVAISAVLIVGVILWYRGVLRRHSGAANALLAKATLSTLPEDDVRRVQERVKALISEYYSLDLSLDDFDAAQRFGWTAIAMYELGIPPIAKLGSQNGWFLVKNPHTAVLPNDKIFKQVSQYLKNRHGLSISLD